MLEGNRITLRDIKEDDLKYIVEWRNDPEILRWFFSYLPLSLAKQKRWYEQYSFDKSKQIFIIEVKNGSEPIGTVGLSDIDYKNQKAEIGILVSKKFQNKGYGSESLNLLLDYAFNEMNLRKITSKVFQDNLPAAKLYEKVGFNREGILEKEIFKAGEYKNIVLMAKFR